jgi:hypothetical protein
MLKAALAATAFLPALACADTCPWLGEDVAAQVMLVKPTEVKLEKNPVFANAQGMIASTTCRFRDANELVGQLSVVVMEFASYEAATAAYRKELKNQDSRAKPSKIGANPAFFTHSPGFSAASYAVKEKRLVFVSHAFSRKVNEAMVKDPEGAVLSTHEVARLALGRL